MKKFLLLLAVLLCLPVFAFAQTTTCTNLTVNLSYGMQGSDVTALQKFLNSKNYLTATPTGFYGNATVAAVKAFQKVYGFEQTGGAGPLTRAKIKEVSCGAGSLLPTTSGNQKPVGSFDSIADGTLSGWAVDPDVPSTSINVDIYVDGNYLGRVAANLESPDITKVFPTYTGNHRFKYTLPSNLINDQIHTIYVYGIDSAGGANAVLNGAPKTTKVNTITGSIDSISANGTVTGWIAKTPNVDSYTLLMIDSDPAVEITPTIVRLDVVAKYPTLSTTTGFEYKIPAKFLDGKDHTLRIINDKNVQFTNSPKVFNSNGTTVQSSVLPNITYDAEGQTGIVTFPSTKTTATLNWNVKNATSCKLQSGTTYENIPLIGSKVITLTTNPVIYNVLCTNSAGTNSGNMIISKSDDGSATKPTVAITINDVSTKSTAVAYNTPVILKWTTTNATICSVYIYKYSAQTVVVPPIESVPVNGSKTISVTEPFSFTVSCGNTKGESGSSNVEVSMKSVGNIDSISAEGVVKGWAINGQTLYNGPYLNISIDGVNTFSQPVTSLSRPDVVTVYPTFPSTSGFEYTIPSQYKDGKAHVIAISSGLSSNAYPLNGSPKSFIFGQSSTQVTSVAPTVTVSTNGQTNTVTVPENTAATINWSSTNATSCTLSSYPTLSYWSGDVGVSGSRTTSVLAASSRYEFYVTCKDATGLTTKSTLFITTGGVPAGSLDTVSADGTVTGWSVSSPTLYIDDQSMWAKIYPTTVTRADLAGIPNASGFKFIIPSSYFDNTSHKIDVKQYNTLLQSISLSGSPKSIVLGTPINKSPVGYLDGISGTTVTGWTVDPDVPSTSTSVDIYMDGAYGAGGIMLAHVQANLASPDITSSNSLYTGNHRFSYTIPDAYKDGKTHAVYVYGIDATGNPNSLLGNSPKSFTLAAPVTNTTTQQPTTTSTNTTTTTTVLTPVATYSPVGSNDGVVGLTAGGWAVDPDGPGIPIQVDIYIDGAYGAGGTLLTRAQANLASPDVTAANPQYTGNHRYLYTIPAQYRDGKTHTLYVYGIDATGNPNTLLSNSARSFSIPTLKTPVGWVDGFVNGTVTGWAVDPDVPGTPISVDVYIDGAYGAGGTMLGRFDANLPSPDVTAAAPAYTGNHRFSYTIPAQYKDGKVHSVYVYGIDATNNGNVLLSGSPKSATLTMDTVEKSLQIAAIEAAIQRLLEQLQTAI